MKEVSLSGSVRTNVGKKDAKTIRRNGNVPCVVYGGETQTHFSVSHVALEKLVYTPNVYIINVDIDGKTTRAIIQDIQFHPVTDKIWHVDFIELDPKKKVKMNIPVLLEGRALGVLNGGRLQQIFRTVKVFALPDNMPDSITVDISKLRIGHSIRIKDLVTDTLDILNAPNAVVCSVKMARGAVDEDEEEEGAEGEEGAEAATEEAEA